MVKASWPQGATISCASPAERFRIFLVLYYLQFHFFVGYSSDSFLIYCCNYRFEQVKTCKNYCTSLPYLKGMFSWFCHFDECLNNLYIRKQKVIYHLHFPRYSDQLKAYILEKVQKYLFYRNCYLRQLIHYQTLWKNNYFLMWDMASC